MVRGLTQGTTIKCTASGARLNFESDTTIHSGFTIDGDSVATNPMRVGSSFGQTFIGVTVHRANDDNLVVYDAQQATSTPATQPTRT